MAQNYPCQIPKKTRLNILSQNHKKKGLGFPQLRIMVLIALGSGALLDSAVAACKGKGTGEQALLRQMRSSLNAGDILLADANFENYFLLVQLLDAGIDAVFEKNGSRNIDFRKCQEKLGKRDGLFRLVRPMRPDWMTLEVYDQMPEERVVRAVGNKKRIIMTTLTDPKTYPKKEIIKLYMERWHVELDFRSIKIMMKMDILRCESPAMVRKEIDVHLLVYPSPFKMLRCCQRSLTPITYYLQARGGFVHWPPSSISKYNGYSSLCSRPAPCSRPAQ